uniref:Follistatin like 3 n=1 Tax=Strix occidentalis caurina TaxID=311401 RepID=A0A8D0EJE3_STROC
VHHRWPGRGPAALGTVAQHGGDPSPSALPAGGICWLQQGKEAKCTMILKTGVTWEECCANGNVDVAWSNYTYPGNKISLLGFLGLVTCHPCKESCEGVVCGPDKVCKMKHGRPQCACAPDCSSLPRKLQVCGSDGYTYRDECDLLTAKCRDHPDLEVMYQGKCKSRSGRNYYDYFCQPSEMLCLSNSGLHREMWGKKCELQAGTVAGGHPSRLSRDPVCFPAESCSSVVCPGTHTCVVDQTGSAHCVMCRTAPCPEPTSLDRALCGNNNVTYPSACHLRRATCHRGRSIGVRHYGSCSGEWGGPGMGGSGLGPPAPTRPTHPPHRFFSSPAPFPAAAKFSPEMDNAEENYV